MSEFATPPIEPQALTLESALGVITPEGPTLTRRMTDLEGLFADQSEWASLCASDNRVVYEVTSSPVPEVPRELPQSVTTIYPGTCGGEFHMTKGHQHPDPQGEIYLGLEGSGGLLMFDGTSTKWIDMAPGTIGYIPPGWAHRSVNTGTQTYRFLAVYPGSAGHDYGWVLKHGMGNRVMQDGSGYDLVPYSASSPAG